MVEFGQEFGVSGRYAKLFQLTAILGAALLLPACGVTISQETRSPAPLYTPSTLSYAAKSGGVKTVIRGQPFAGDTAQFAETVTAAMYGSHFGPDDEFVRNRSGISGHDYTGNNDLVSPRKSIYPRQGMWQSALMLTSIGTPVALPICLTKREGRH